MTERFAAADLHAYVDNCLDRERRSALEAKLQKDPQMLRRVQLWQSQNEAIRAAFGAPSRSRGPLSLGLTSNENFVARAASEVVRRKTAAAESAATAGPAKAKGARTEAPAKAAPPARRRWPPTRRWVYVLGLAAALVGLSAAGGPADPRGALIDAGLSAYRAFATTASPPLDFATRDPQALLNWLGPRFASLKVAARLDAPGWTLQGVRMVPGIRSAAAFIILENAERARIGILAEPLDAPVSRAPTSAKGAGVSAASRTDDGYGVAVMGPDPGLVARLIRPRGSFATMR